MRQSRQTVDGTGFCGARIADVVRVSRRRISRDPLARRIVQLKPVAQAVSIGVESRQSRAPLYRAGRARRDEVTGFDLLAKEIQYSRTVE